MKNMIFSALLAVLMLPVTTSANAANPVWLEGKTDEAYQITVYRSATCGCCKGWIAHLKDHNFQVKDVVVEDVNAHKQRLGVPPKGASCHTAEVNGKVVEGHVPAQDIKRLLSSENNIRLLTVPGMPSGGPGMDMPGAAKQPFQVFSVTEDNKVDVYNNYSEY
ncbi:DUF411 domain-containing protein [Pontibacterium sp.]|uniref:DUF411 domain-containing protein n=1 Tax=Pontibacterium sp. TaxID=2036026 RepID=UPI003510FE20